MANFECTPNFSVASPAQEFQDCFRCVQQVRQQSTLEVPQNQLELRFILVDEPIVVPSSANSLGLKLLEAQHNKLCKEIERSQECLLARESELVTE